MQINSGFEYQEQKLDASKFETRREYHGVIFFVAKRSIILIKIYLNAIE